MTTDYAWLPATLTANQAIERLRQQAPDRETIYYVYILDEITRKLLGVISLRDLILADRSTTLNDLMEKDIVCLQVTEDQEKAAKDLARYDFLAMPVVDDEFRLVGIVTHDDVIDVINREATEDLQRQAAVGSINENYLEAGFFTIWRKRSFWLACLFGAELLTFTALAQFEDALAAILVLSLFIPLCISTGGNSGSQAATLITRSLALGHITTRDWKRVLRHEIFMGLALGVTLGVIGLLRGFMTSEELRSDTKERPEPFDIFLPLDQELKPNPDGSYDIPAGTDLASRVPLKRSAQITLPQNSEVVSGEIESDSKERRYSFPAQSTTRVETVSRWKLALVISQSIAAICLWGTLIGAMLPLFLRRLGIDPAMASSPFVATFVDVTGIVIYFNIAKMYLL